MRPVYAGILGGVFNILALLLPLYLVMPGQYSVDWPQVSPRLGDVGYALALLSTLGAGYSAARWGWATSKLESVKSGTLAGVLAGIVAWLGVGAAAAGVMGHDLMFQYGPRAAGDMELLILLTEADVQVSYMTHLSFWIMSIVGAIVGAVGGWIYGLHRASVWGARPAPFSEAIRQALSNVILLVAAFQAIMAVGIFYLLANQVQELAQEASHPLSLPASGVFVLPAVEMLGTMMVATWWNWRQVAMLRASADVTMRFALWSNSLLTLIIPLGTVMVIGLIVVSLEIYPALFVSAIGLIAVTLIGEIRALFGKLPPQAPPVSSRFIGREWRDFVLLSWLVVATLFMLGAVAVNVSLVMGTIVWINVLSGYSAGLHPPAVDSTVRDIFTIQAAISLGLLAVPLSFVLANQGFGYLQDRAAQNAQIQLDQDRLRSCVTIKAIAQVHQRLTLVQVQSIEHTLLRNFSRVSRDIDAALQQESTYNQRLALGAVEDRLNDLWRELNISAAPYAQRFSSVVTLWREVVSGYIRELGEAAEQRQEIDSPYIIGVPLTEQQEIFVGRTDITSRIEGLLIDRRRPPFLLYGQRRMGKTSLLNNLGRLLPSTIVPLFVDLQGSPTQASDHTGFLYNLARRMAVSAEQHRGVRLPKLPQEALRSDPFTSFDEWLDEVEMVLDERTALLALDEFESLDTALSKGRFDEESVLGMLRNLIQHRPRFKVLLAGSHTLSELQRWSSYLINVQVVHVGYLSEAETQQLIERPVKEFALRYEPDASRRVRELTRGHPFLVQLLCAEIVAMKNEQEPSVRRLAHRHDVEVAIPEALNSGRFFFTDIEHNQVDDAGRAILHYLGVQDEGAVVLRSDLDRQCSDDLDSALDLLSRRELIEPANGGYRFQVELIRRWFTQQQDQSLTLHR